MLIEVAVAILKSGNQVWLQRRVGTGHLDGLWEFPGGKIEPGESPREALQRELLEESGLFTRLSSAEPFESLTHSYGERTVRLHFFLIHLSPDQGQPRGNGRWITGSELEQLPTPAANAPVISRLIPILER